MIPFLLAVNVHTGNATFEIAEADFVGGLNSRDFHGQVHITKNDKKKIKFEAVNHHLWVEGNIDYTPSAQFKIRLTTDGASSGWYRLNGVQYPDDGLWRGFTFRTTLTGVGFAPEAEVEEFSE